MSIDTFLEVPVSFLSPAFANELRTAITEEEFHEIIDVSFDCGRYDIAGETLSYIDLVERLEDWSNSPGIQLIILRTDAADILSHANLVESFQRISLKQRRETTFVRRMHLAMVVR